MPDPEKYASVTDAISTGDFKKAIKVLIPILKEEPENVGLLLDAGFIYANLDNFEEAITHYKKVIELAPTNSAGYTGLGFVYKFQGNDEERLKMFEEAVKLSPSNAMVHFEVGETYLEMEKYKEALTSFNKAIQFGGIETEAETLIRIAQTNMGLNKPDKTIEIGENIIKNFPEYRAGAYYIMAGANAMLEKYEEAIKLIKQYLEMEPDDEDAKEMLEHLKEEIAE